MTTPPAPTGRLLDGRYRLESRLGGGAVAEVFRATDERLARPVAVKVFRGDAAEQLQRHEDEMRTLARLDHPSLVTVFDAGSDAQTHQPYLVMQLVDGLTLADELRDGRLPGERVARYGAALADALGYVHAQGFVHRDVKPANVLVSDDGRVHLADFGIARLVDSAHVTKTGEVLGTPMYFAPEQVAGEAVGPPADVYALGIVLLECLTGRRPFEGTPMEVAMARLSRPPDVPATLPESWRALLGAMLARQPDDRPAAGEVADALRRISAGQPVDERTVALARRAAVSQTAVMPPTAVATHAAVTTQPAYQQPAPAARRRGPTAAVVVLVLVLVAAAAVAVALAVNRNSGTATPTNFTPGTPRLHPAPLESDMQDLEKLVRR